MRALALVAVLLCAFVYYSGAQLQFDVSVTGSFRHDAVGINCDYCDCTTGDCTWFDNFTCTDPGFAQFGADDNQQRWGSCNTNPSENPLGCFCFTQSGVGFQGVSDVSLVANADDGTRIGRITHYNNPITGSTPTRLRLTLTVTSPQLNQQFVISYPLPFIETTNFGSIDRCDPGIQRTLSPCDDRFSFEDVRLTDSFIVNNTQYTLEILGFLQPPDTVPIKKFVTEEKNTSRADVYARIITFCVDSECPPFTAFVPPPECACVCVLTDQLCQDALGADWRKDNDTCDCICDKQPSTCLANETLNAETCTCGCPLSGDECASINPLYGVTADCVCGCDKSKVLSCFLRNVFFVPDPQDNCDCVCQISDQACQEYFGQDFTADFANCACIPPGGDGLTDGEIVGIVIGSVAGAAGLILLVLLVSGLLVWLIRSGTIPGIYGYKIDAADLSTAQESPFYKDTWSAPANTLGD